MQAIFSIFILIVHHVPIISDSGIYTKRLDLIKRALTS
jgi:hypothetical protein